VHPTRSQVLSRKGLFGFTKIPEAIDLAMIATPAGDGAGDNPAMRAIGVSAAVIVSAGFRECGASGVALEREISHGHSAGRRADAHCRAKLPWPWPARQLG